MGVEQTKAVEDQAVAFNFALAVLAVLTAAASFAISLVPPGGWLVGIRILAGCLAGSRPLSELAAEFAVGEIAFAALFEIGGELWVNAAMAARVMVVAERCARIIEKLIELARGAAPIAKAAKEAIANIVAKIKSVIAAFVSKVTGVEAESARLSSIAERFHSDLDKVAWRMRTTSVLSNREGTDVVASAGRDLTPKQKLLLEDGKVAATKSPRTHAEITAHDSALADGLTPSQTVATRQICTECQPEIIARGGTILPDGLEAIWP